MEEGLHEEADFSYVVRNENPHPEKMSVEELAQKKLRPLWQSKTSEEKRKYISVTELVAPDAVTSGDFVQKAAQIGTGLQRAQQGTNAHRLFEALKYTPYQELVKISDEDLKKPLEFLAETPSIPLLKIIEQGYVEWGFAMVEQKALMQGQIDLWGIVDDVLWMVDYKTGSPKYSETAFRQLEAYAWAIYRMGYAQTVKSVKLAVVYPMDEIVKIEEIKDLGDLNSRMKSKIADYIKS